MAGRGLCMTQSGGPRCDRCVEGQFNGKIKITLILHEGSKSKSKCCFVESISRISSAFSTSGKGKGGLCTGLGGPLGNVP